MTPEEYFEACFVKRMDDMFAVVFQKFTCV